MLGFSLGSLFAFALANPDRVPNDVAIAMSPTVGWLMLACAVCVALMFLLQTFSLKRKHLRGVFNFLPSIVALETINFRLLLTGISVLSVSIILGAVYFAKEPGSIAATKLLVALAVWCAYAAVFFLRTRRLLVSEGLAWSCLALFGVALYSIGVINAGMARHAMPKPGSALVVPQARDAEVA